MLFGKFLQLLTICLFCVTHIFAIDNTIKFQRISTPELPLIDAKAFIAVDLYSETIVAEKEAEQQIEPASMTKLMTLYIIAKYLHDGLIQPDDMVKISHQAWRAEGSKMFLKEGTSVSIDHLIQGIIVASGNDASIAMAEHIAGGETAFARLMNTQAKLIGMNQTNFTNATGLPDDQLHTSVLDLAKLAAAFWQNYPEFMSRFSQKWFEWDGVKQPNTNRLLWRDNSIDGMKTGHTATAGYCLISSANRLNSKIITIIAGSDSPNNRDQATKNLLTWTEKHFSHHALSVNKLINPMPRIWRTNELVDINEQTIHITTRRHVDQLTVNAAFNSPLIAPIKRHQDIGTITLSTGEEIIREVQLTSAHSVQPSGIITTLIQIPRYIYQRLWHLSLFKTNPEHAQERTIRLS